MQQDIRWKQRFANYDKAIMQLQKFIKKKKLNELEEQGLIQAFEYTYELAWNVMRDFFEFQGDDTAKGSRDAIRLAFNRGLLVDGKIWMDMIESRIKSSHTYNEAIVKEIKTKIIDNYITAFIQFRDTMQKR